MKIFSNLFFLILPNDVFEHCESPSGPVPMHPAFPFSIRNVLRLSPLPSHIHPGQVDVGHCQSFVTVAKVTKTSISVLARPLACIPNCSPLEYPLFFSLQITRLVQRCWSFDWLACLTERWLNATCAPVFCQLVFFLRGGKGSIPEMTEWYEMKT